MRPTTWMYALGAREFWVGRESWLKPNLEYRQILAINPGDPDNWMGLAAVYSREEQTGQALQALDHAVELDPKRADIHATRASTLQTLGATGAAKLELDRAVDLDPTYAAARARVLSSQFSPSHELRIGVNSDLFNFADANQNAGISLVSNWTP